MMTEQVSPAEHKSTKNQGLSRYKGWLVVAVIVLPMLSAYLIFNTGIGMPTSTINKGDLLFPATSIVDIDMLNDEGQKFDLIGSKKLWRMLLVTDNQCDDVCLQKLYLSRQVHIRLGEKAMRVERVLVNAGPDFSDEFKNYLTTEHPRLITASVNKQQWQDNFSASSIAVHQLDGSHIYYVDLEGFTMMSYDKSHDGAALLSDIKRLLKYSYDE
jgi:hypothetical protein